MLRNPIRGTGNPRAKASTERASGDPRNAPHFVSRRRTSCKGGKARAVNPGTSLPATRVLLPMVLGNSGLFLDVHQVCRMLINLLRHHVSVVPVVRRHLQEVCDDVS